MKPIFDKVAYLDERAIKKYKMNGSVLMEHAALGLFCQIKQYMETGTVLIVCGSGNNGGDGFALARLLLTNGYQPIVHMQNPPASDDAIEQYEILQNLDIPIIEDFSNMCVDVIVDALFGSGLNRNLEQWAVTLIEKMNSIKGYKIACDIPS
ncbi:MAG: NAD(P)H-hydrate epimerase, partial [Campylobacterales bacterium]|nr:NAD(P)H-hydrate epimerase [Campylobacterales bacterium]